MSLDSCDSDFSSSDGPASPTEELPHIFEPFVKETEDLLVDYFGFRLRSKLRQSSLRGLPREYLIPPVNPSNKAIKLRNLALSLENQHEHLFKQICLKVDLSEFQAKRSFDLIAEEIFSNEIHWGRIVSLITFTGVVAHYLIEQERPEMVEELMNWLLSFVRANLMTWIIANGGWVGLVFSTSRMKPLTLTQRKYLAG